jgi:hypothetical protein
MVLGLDMRFLGQKRRKYFERKIKPINSAIWRGNKYVG